MRKITLLFIVFFVSSCGGFEFVYKTNTYNIALKDKTDISVSGDDQDIIRVVLRDSIGEKNTDFPKYKLTVVSSKNETAAVINKDATVSKFNIEYIITYDLYSLYKNCKVYAKAITTINSYNARSSGYSFGTELSQKESSNQNINKNIQEFLSTLNNQISDIDNCIK